MRGTHDLVVERGNDVISALLALDHNLRDHDRARLQYTAASHHAAHGRHGVLDVGRGRARSKVLRHDHERPREAADRDPLVERPPSGGHRRHRRRGPDLSLLGPYQGLRHLLGSSLRRSGGSGAGRGDTAG